MILCMWSDHDRIRPHAKYQRRERLGSRPKKKKTAFIILCAPRQLGAHKMTKTSATSWSFPLILCMWSDPIRIRPHAKYQRREWSGSRSEKKKTTFDHCGYFCFCCCCVGGGWLDTYVLRVSSTGSIFVKNPILTIDRHRPVRTRSTLPL
jgi:hypothetical protein